MYKTTIFDHKNEPLTELHISKDTIPYTNFVIDIVIHLIGQLILPFLQWHDIVKLMFTCKTFFNL